jgi:hypothetical protein
MKKIQHCINTYDWALRILAIGKARGTLNISDEALSEIYEMLSDEEKIAFMLAGGMPPLLQCPQMRTDADSHTDALPILC